MVTEVKLIYKGTRLSYDNRRVFHYCTIDNISESLVFRKKLLGYESIGSILSCNREDTKFSNYEPKGMVDKNHDAWENITQWSLEQKSANLKLKAIQDNKKKLPNHIQSLVKQIKGCTMGFNKTEKARIANWVFNELL